MTQMICLANSRKNSDRCVAGIDKSTRLWVRPTTRLDDGRIPVKLCIINGKPIRPLDAIDVSLTDESPGYECENRVMFSTRWKRIGTVPYKEIQPFCETEILHSHRDDFLTAVPYNYLLQLPKPKRRTLQVIETTDFRVVRNGQNKWRGSIPLDGSDRLFATITDPEFCQKLDTGHQPSNPCLVVFSFSQPWSQSYGEEELRCYRLIAAVIESKNNDH